MTPKWRETPVGRRVQQRRGHTIVYAKGEKQGENRMREERTIIHVNLLYDKREKRVNEERTAEEFKRRTE